MQARLWMLSAAVVIAAAVLAAHAPIVDDPFLGNAAQCSPAVNTASAG
jgi:hypothetical protein